MDAKQYEQLKSRIHYSVRKMFGDSLDAEDAVQSILLTWLSRQGKGRQTVDQAVIDYARRTIGDPRSGSFNSRKSLYQATSDGLERINEETRQSQENGDWVTEILCGMERVIWVLLTKWGMSEVEVADIIGVSSSRVSQRLKAIQSRLSARVTKKARSQGKTENKLEAILREKETANWKRVESFEDKTLARGKSW